jgi:hypothetical protein
VLFHIHLPRRKDHNTRLRISALPRFVGNPIAIRVALEPALHPRFKRPTPTKYRPDLPAWLDEALARATAANPDDRFGDVFEFIFALEHGAIRAAPASPRRLPLYERNPLLVWKIVAALLAHALGVSLVLNPVLRHGAQSERPAATQR